MDKLPVGQLPDLQQSNNDDEIMVITNSEYSQLKKEKISDLITDFTSTNENNALTKGTDGKMFVTDFGNASNITEGTLPTSVLPDIPKDKLPEIETDDLPDSGITAGTYTYPTDIVVNSKGQVTSITEGQAGANNANQDLSNLGPLGLDKINQSKALETGSVSSDADVYADVQKYAHSTFDLSKFEVVGSPTITDDGVASGFSSSSYVKKSINLITNNLVITGKTIIDNSQPIINIIFSTSPSSVSPTNYIDGLRLQWESFNNQIRFAAQINGVDSNIIPKLSINIENGDLLEYKLTLKSGNSSFEYSINGVKQPTYTPTTTWDLDFNITSIRIGAYANLYYAGSIDLKHFSITADGVEVFNGNKTGLDVIKSDNYSVVGSPVISDDGVASGFNNSNNVTSKENIVIPSTTKSIEILGSFIIGEQNDTAQQFYNFNNGLRGEVKNDYTAIAFFPPSGFTGGLYMFLSLNNGDTVKYQYKIDFITGVCKATCYINSGEAISKTVTTSGTFSGIDTKVKVSGLNYAFQGSIDLNSFQIYVDDNLVYQPCLKIPYTLSKTGSKIVDAAYRNRVQDLYEQEGYAPYYTIDEANKNFTLPMGEIYGMLEKNSESNYESLLDKLYPIGYPMPSLDGKLNSGEIWLEGATINISSYQSLYAVYGTTYGGDGVTTFQLPDMRNRVLWGSGDATYGSVAAGLPNITGHFSLLKSDSGGASDAFYISGSGWVNTAAANGAGRYIYMSASRSSSIYGNSTTVQPPALKVRWKTRYR